MLRWLVIGAVAIAGCVGGYGPSGGPGDDGDTRVTGGDPSGGDPESDSGPSDDGGAHCPATIADIKNGTVAVGESACLKAVTVTAASDSGVFVGTPDAQSLGGLFLASPAGPSVDVGDTINVGVAAVQTSAGELQLHGPTLMVTSSGNQPSPVVVAASDLASDSTTDEDVEAMLVFVPTVTVVSTSADSFMVSDDGGDHTVTVGGFLSQAVLNVNPGDLFDSITGVWRATANGYALEPRGEFDLEPAF